MENNTISEIPTRFLTGVNLIIEARKTFNICSENWTYPKLTFGDKNSEYYAEIWTDGMDYNNTYWIIEGGYFSGGGKAKPLLFIDNKERNKFNDYDFNRLLLGLLWRRRNVILENKNGFNFTDDFSYLKKYENIINNIFQKCTYEHASQEEVEFYINVEFLKVYDI